MELIDTAQRLGLRTSVLSNGYRIPRLIEQFGTQFMKLSIVQISLDSARPEIHDARRGKSGAWRQAVAAIRALRRARIPCEVSCTVSQENLGDLKRLSSFCRRLGLKLIARPLVAFGRGKDALLAPVEQSSFHAELAEVERQNPGTIVTDRFWYVPDGASFDSKARDKGIVTVLPSGKFRLGRVFFPKLKRDFASVLDTFAAAAATCPA
jgi:MoaA/NifB/PqqE/SkfB family radical SAM enzyme